MDRSPAPFSPPGFAVPLAVKKRQAAGYSSNPWGVPLQPQPNARNGLGDTSIFSTSLPVLPHGKLISPDSAHGTPLMDDTSAILKDSNDDPLRNDYKFDFDLRQNDDLLPDEDDLFAGITNEIEPSAQTNPAEELEEFDVFGSGGGMELDSDPLEGITTGLGNTSIGDGLRGNGANNFGLSNSPGAVAGEHPFGEHPSRTLFVRNINSNVEDSELRSLFEQFGDIRTLCTATKHRGFVMISYFDIRAARGAMRSLQNKPLRRRKLDIHFSIPMENPSDKDLNQGTLVIFNLDPSVSNEEVCQIFGTYGEVKEIRETPNKKHHKFIEFYDVRAAEAALRSLNKSGIAGKRIKLEPSRPGGTRRSLQMDHDVSTSHAVLERMLLDESAEPMSLPLSLLQYITNGFSPDHQIGSGGFAVVYKGKVGNGVVAVKKLLNTFDIHERKFHEEVRCLIKAKHKNIVRFLGYCADVQGKLENYEGMLVMADQRNWLLCFEYVCNGSLDKHITDASCGLKWRDRYRIIRGICEGLLFLHEMRILHLDLKPANILLDVHMVPKIADFGLSRCLGEDQTRAITQNISGTLGYMDPEYLRSGQIAFASDIYSLGVIIMEILTGVKGYLEDEYVVESWMNQLDASEWAMQLEQVRVCSRLGTECMNLDPKKRPVARHIIDRLDEATSVDYSSSISTGVYQLNYLEIFNRKARRNFDRNYTRTFKDSYLINIFSKEELMPILRSGNLIGKGIRTNVYRGVVDNALVTVKKLIDGNVLEKEQLENEFIIQSQISHKNIVWLIGCCLEIDTPILVYEFLPRGSLHDILHSRSQMPLNLDVRLNIVAETAHGLAYLHSQARTIIRHGDVKPASILLDDNLIPKISEFGLSRLITRDKGHNGYVIGDKTYMDPVYLETGLLSEKSDVYSFGIVILEVICRKKASHTDNFSLVNSFLEVQKEGNKATDLFDKEIAVTGDLELLDSLAEIAVECLNLDIKQRPSMTDVVGRLAILNRSHRLHAQHICADYSDETDIGSSFVEQMKEDTNHPDASNSNRKAPSDFDRNNRRILDKSHFIKIFRNKKLTRMSCILIRKGSLADVYMGVVDNARVVVKKIVNGTVEQNIQFEDYVLMQSHVIHKNIVRLIGFFVEMDYPVLVYEFITGSSLDSRLHNIDPVHLKLDQRLNMIAESANGLAYLHSQARIRCMHGDVKPSEILLDRDGIPKISGLGLLRSFARDKELTSRIVGDLTYMDPVYQKTGVLTKKSDVYSFGIVILEVISRKKSTYSDGNNNLVKGFVEVHQRGEKATDLFDKDIAVAGNLEILDCLAEIAVECLNLDVDQRPTMTYVAERLITLQRLHRPPQ